MCAYGMPGLLTAAEMQRVRTDRAAVNHATYKGILEKVYDRVRHHAAMNRSDAVYAVPGFVPGRPMYDVTHATRYVAEKLRLGGFKVEVRDDGTLAIDWAKPPPAPRTLPKKKKATRRGDAAEESGDCSRREPAASHAATSHAAAGLSRRLQMLKHKLDFA
jgi:hypothetical protein